MLGLSAIEKWVESKNASVTLDVIFVTFAPVRFIAGILGNSVNNYSTKLIIMQFFLGVAFVLRWWLMPRDRVWAFLGAAFGGGFQRKERERSAHPHDRPGAFSCGRRQRAANAIRAVVWQAWDHRKERSSPQRDNARSLLAAHLREGSARPHCVSVHGRRMPACGASNKVAPRNLTHGLV
jgi:hypothetical protein